MTRGAFVLGLVTMPLVGCQTVSPRGDANTRGEGVFKTTSLPKFDLGQRGVHEFVVSDLKERAFPYSLRIHSRTRPSSFIGPVTFDNAVVRVEVLDHSAGTVLDSKTFGLRIWELVRDDVYEVIFYRPNYPPIAARGSYRVRATVLKPSQRPYDEGQLMLR